MRHYDRIEGSLLARVDATPLSEALVDGERRFDYDTLGRWALSFARRLTESGVAPGDRVAIYLDQVAEMVVALYGTWIAGAVAVPTNASLKSAQVAHILSHSGSRLLVSTPRKLAQIDAQAVGDIPVLEVDAWDGVERSAPHKDLPGGATPAAILYTSGSTGRPKGILISHANLIAGARIVSGYLGIRSDERILSLLPFSFDYGLNQVLSSVYCGSTLVLQRSHFPADVVRSLEQNRITGFAGIPAVWSQLMDRKSPLPGVQLPHLRYITNSGGVFPRELLQRYREMWPHVRIYLMYGLSEAFRSTYLPPEELDRRPDSMGKAIPECEILVLDSQNKLCAAGQEGELVHRGPTVALGYWNDPEATARVFRPDPLEPGSGRTVVHSGDVVRRDEEGFLYFVGRRDQLIKSFGFRISPDEVEELIHASKLVAEVAVHGLPDEEAGARIVAHVIPADQDAFELQALVDYCRERMPSYMVPRTIAVHDSLPRTASGKIDRKALAG
jgi:acyl-CoA ligase (AMP-forming) (exosortase A-associated)